MTFDKIRYGRVGKKIGHLTRERRKLDTRHFMVPIEQAVAEGVDETPLGKVFADHRGRSIFKWTHYIDAYDEQFGQFRDGVVEPDGTRRPVRMVEIGVLHGGSLQLWRSYFGPDAVIFGVDINPQVEAIDDPDLEVRIGSQADPEFLRRVVAEMGGVDIVLDDGSHVDKHQDVSFQTLFPLLSDGGIYAVEDLHTSYWFDFGGAHGRRGFIETVKRLVDDMHAWYHPKGDQVGVDAATTIPKITFYDSVAFIQKRTRPRPRVVKFGEESYQLDPTVMRGRRTSR